MSQPPDDLERRFRAALGDTCESGCPPADSYWAAAAGELPLERLQALVDHGARCAHCAEAWRILAEVRREAAAPEAPAGAPRPLATRPALRKRTALLPVGLSALAALAFWLVLRPGPPPPPGVERGNGADAVRAESSVSQPAREIVLRWSEVPDATSYNVTVLTPDLVVLHRAIGVTARELRLPEALGQHTGTRVLWNVDAVLRDGRTVASPTFELQLR